MQLPGGMQLMMMSGGENLTDADDGMMKSKTLTLDVEWRRLGEERVFLMK